MNLISRVTLSITMKYNQGEQPYEEIATQTLAQMGLSGKLILSDFPDYEFLLFTEEKGDE